MQIHTHTATSTLTPATASNSVQTGMHLTTAVFVVAEYIITVVYRQCVIIALQLPNYVS